ncbi:MAG TPA: STAS domain-containing protein [bacterium]|nr:STAS domain-containing protein [Candidatus Omnitrophota bacterium]HOJ61286.1 STAS domain-containing protein [bacterium]HOL93100.1 STAS domain-containing protein [bacterium]HPP02458.1 STAS domain-containing protein [bacterium]
MKIDSRMIGDVMVLSLMGEIDSRGNQQLDKTLAEAADKGHYKIILDLSSIRFLGNQTLSLLLSHLKEFRGNRGDIKFLNPQRGLLQYLKQNRVIELFSIFSTRSEALAAFTAAPGSETPAPSAEERFAALGTSPAGLRTESPSAAALDKNLKSRFETGEILYANSCMLATLIKSLEAKGILTAEEASELLDYERLPLKGV